MISSQNQRFRDSASKVFKNQTPLNFNVKFNSGLASTEVKTENSNVVIFVKIIKKTLTKLLSKFT